MGVLKTVVALSALAIGGCDRGTTPAILSPATQPAPTTEPVAIAVPVKPATAPADTQPSGSVVTIDGRVYGFPPAMLRLRPSGNTVSALLYTDDPPSALKDDYTGNSYYLHMSLDIEDVQDIGSAHWVYHAPSSDRDDAPDGIFLDGHKVQLQPLDVQVRFSGKSPQVSVNVSGRFLKFSTIRQENPVAPVFANVIAEHLDATVPVK